MTLKLTLAQERVLIWLKEESTYNPRKWHTASSMHCTEATMKALINAGKVETDNNGRLFRLNVGINA